MKRILSFKNVALTFLLVATIMFAQVFSVQAQSGQQWGNIGNIGNIGNQGNFSLACLGTHNVHGQLFSSTIGWIYLNCADYTGGTIGEFGVDQDSGGYWNGYGWSSSVGWIKFGGVGCPQHSGWNVNFAAGATDCNVQHGPLTGNPIQSYPIVGWARACVAAADPVTCSGEGNPSAGGWDGWISMSGLNDQNPTAGGLQTTTNYKTTLSQLVNQNGHQAVSGFVWGGDVIGWAKFFDAYIDTTVVIQNTAHITLTATPTSVVGNGTTVLKYEINPSEKAYFTGAPCTASTVTTPTSGTPWDGTHPNFSSTSTVFSTSISGVAVTANTTTYKISCPVSIPNNPNQTTATATATVTKNMPTVTLTIPNHDICASGSLNGLQSTTVSWVASEGDHCVLYRDGVAASGNLPISVLPMPVGPFATPTSTNYVTPVSGNDQHKYEVKCYATANNSTQISSDVSYVGVAPTSWNGPTANGNLNCTQPDWGISIAAGSNQLICQGHDGSLTWNSWGTVPPQYTSAKLKRSPSQNGTYTTIGTYATADTESNITTAGWYKVFYYDTNGVEAPTSSGEVYFGGSVTSACIHNFSGLSDAGPYCPAGSVNTAAYLPKTYAWTSDADAGCTLDGASASANGTVQISTPGTHQLTCNWADGAIGVSNADFGPMLSADSAFCSSIHTPGGHPSIVEN